MFISFEGLDGSGKSTQAKLLVERLDTAGYDTLLSREPSDLFTGRVIRAHLPEILAHQRPANGQVTALFFMADRILHYGETLALALEQGKIVVCDRYHDSTLAYQGADLGMDKLKWLELLAEQSILMPNATILLDLPAEISLHRAVARNTARGEAHSVFEQKGVDYYNKVRKIYNELQKREQARFCVLDATQSIDSIQSAIWQYLAPKLSGHS